MMSFVKFILIFSVVSCVPKKALTTDEPQKKIEIIYLKAIGDQKQLECAILHLQCRNNNRLTFFAKKYND